jgi:hypothetical protein
MAIYKIFASQDASIYSKFPSMNAGLDEILEVSVKNTSDAYNSLVPSSGSLLIDDIRRSIIKFSNQDISTLQTKATGSWKAFLKIYIADAENLSEDYTLEIRQVSQSWTMGTGKFADSPENRTGVCWYNTGSYTSAVNNWADPEYYITPGGGSWTGLYSTQSFNNESSKDIEADVTTIIQDWFTNPNNNNGLLIKHEQSVENDPNSYIVLNFYSNDTHTIYPPTLELRWDDSSYQSGSLAEITDSYSIVTIANNMATYNVSTDNYRFRINSRDKYPTRVFTTSSFYTTNKRLPSTTYWSLIDAKSNDIVVDFDNDYTKVSCDSMGNYFDLQMNGLEPERYYKLLLKSLLDSGETVVYDNNYIFKVTR